MDKTNYRNEKLLKSEYIPNHSVNFNKSIPRFEKDVLKLDLLNKEIYLLTKAQDDLKDVNNILQKNFWKIFVKYILSVKNYEKLVESFNHYEVKNNQLKYDNVNLKNELDFFKKISEENESLKEFNKELKNEIVLVKSKLDNQNLNCNKYEIQLAEKENKLYEINSELNIIKKELNSDNTIIFNIKNYKSEIKNWNFKIEKMNIENEKISINYKNLELQFNLNENTIDAKEKEIYKLNKIINNSKETINNLSKELNFNSINNNEIDYFIKDISCKYLNKIENNDKLNKENEVLKLHLKNIEENLNQYLNQNNENILNNKNNILNNLSKFNENLIKLKSKTLELESQIKIQTDKNINLENLYNENKNSYNSLIFDYKNNQTDLKILQESNSNLDIKYKDLSNKYDNLYEEHNIKLKEFSGINTIIKENFDEIKELKQKNLKLESTLINSIEKDKHLLVINNFNNQINTLNTTIMNQKIKNDEFAQELIKSNKEKEKLIAKLEEINKTNELEINHKDSEISNLKLDKIKLQEKQKNLEDNKKSESSRLNEEINFLNSKSQNYQNNNEKLENQIEIKKDKNIILNKELDELKLEINTLKKEIKNKNKTISLLKERESSINKFYTEDVNKVNRIVNQSQTIKNYNNLEIDFKSNNDPSSLKQFLLINEIKKLRTKCEKYEELWNLN